MKASFAIVAAVTPQAPLAKQNQTGDFRNALGSLLPGFSQNGLQAARPAAGGSATSVTPAVVQEASRLLPNDAGVHAQPDTLPDSHPGTGPRESQVGTAKPQLGSESGLGSEPTPEEAEVASGSRVFQKPTLPSLASNVVAATTAKGRDVGSIVESGGNAGKATALRQRSSPRQTASDASPQSDASRPAVPGPDVPALVLTPVLPTLQVPASENGIPQPAKPHSDPQTSRLASIVTASAKAALAGTQSIPDSSSQTSGAAFPSAGLAGVPVDSTSHSHERAGANPTALSNAVRSPRLPPAASGNQTSVAGAIGSHSNPSTAPAPTRSTRVDEVSGAEDHAIEHPRVSPAVALHGTLATQLREVVSPDAPAKASDVLAPGSVLQGAVESSPSSRPTVAGHAATQDTALSVLQKLDTPVPAQPISLRVDSRHLDVGVQSSALGWIEVRATSGASGSVDATIHVQSDALAKDLSGQSGTIVAFAREHSVGVGQLSVGVGSGESGRQEHPQSQLKAGEQERDEPGSEVLGSPGDRPPGLSLISIRA